MTLVVLVVVIVVVVVIVGVAGNGVVETGSFTLFYFAVKVCYQIHVIPR